MVNLVGMEGAINMKTSLNLLKYYGFLSYLLPHPPHKLLENLLYLLKSPYFKR